MGKIETSVDVIINEIISNSSTWLLGYSGGKDSTALLILTIRAIESFKKLPDGFKLIVIYCDTGVEIPTVRDLTKKQISKFRTYCKLKKIPVIFKVSRPRVEDSFFVKVIGRGYVPPTNKFRWCTDRLRISPVERIIKRHVNSDSRTRILLGVRNGESLERDRVIKKHKKDKYLLTQAVTKRTIFAPIIDLTVTDVWNTIIESDCILKGLQYKLLAQYRNASGECPMIKDPNSSPCAQGRFGCWTCTVVRKDKSVTNLIESGENQLLPLLEFRNWLAEVRNLSSYREPLRRNGSLGPGPFKMKARRKILLSLKETEKRSGMKLIFPKELIEIKRLWALDQKKPKRF